MERALKFILVLTVLAAPLLPAQGQSITRGPYLQMGNTTAITVKWRTDTRTDSVVRYGASTDSLTQTASNPTSTTEHEVRLTGLTPDTKYSYSVGSSAAMLAGGSDYYFVTAPTTARPTRIWALGDFGTGDMKQKAVRDAYYNFTDERETDVWLMLGDNAYSDGSESEYQDNVFDIYPTLLRKTVAWPTFGNHDGRTASSTDQSGPYYSIFALPRYGEAGGVPSGTEAYYSYDYGNIHFICLNSFDVSREPGGAMLTWLGLDLAQTTKDWIIAYWHHPPYSKGSHDSDEETELIEMREYALPILEAGGVDLVLSGHSHCYERSYLLDGHYGYSSTITSAMVVDGGSGRADGTGAYSKPGGNVANQGAVYIVAGSGGQLSHGSLNHPAMFISMSQLGSVVVDIEGKRMDVKFVRSTGAVADYFTLTKGPSTPTPPVPPSGLTATAGNGQVALAWEASPGATRYNVKRAASGGGPYATIGTATTLSYVNSGLTNGTAYYFVVSAVNTVGESANSSPATATPVSTQLYEAELAALSGAIPYASQSGYSGTGYAKYVNNSGDYVEWTVSASRAGTYEMEFRYSNGSSTDRPLEFRINGAVVNSRRSFPPTGAWNRWGLVTNQVALAAGNNTVRFTATGSNGPNLDYLRLRPTSAPSIHVTIRLDAAGRPVLTWNSAAGKVYRVAYKARLSDANWTDLSGDITASNSTTTQTDASLASSSTRYYRVYLMN